MHPVARPRWLYALFALIVIALGLASRKLSGLPPLVSIHAGDTLWALLVFILIGLIAAHWSPVRVAAAALVFAFAIEFSQLYQADWLNELRQQTLIALVIGRGFVGWDLLRYSVGIGIGFALEYGFYDSQRQKN